MSVGVLDAQILGVATLVVDDAWMAEFPYHAALFGLGCAKFDVGATKLGGAILVALTDGRTVALGVPLLSHAFPADGTRLDGTVESGSVLTAVVLFGITGHDVGLRLTTDELLAPLGGTIGETVAGLGTVTIHAHLGVTILRLLTQRGVAPVYWLT